MSSVLHPVGSQPSRVYWVRRAVLLALVVVAVTVGALAFRLVSAGGSVATGAPSTAATTAADTTTGSPKPCPTSALTVALTADAATYAAKSNPTFTYTLTNAGTDPCTVDSGDTARELLITSGSDRIWSSKDCAPAASPAKLLLLTPAKPYSAAVPWPRVRSASGCPASLPAPRAGTYQATASLGGVTSSVIALQLG
jgi:hypothetical protein